VRSSFKFAILIFANLLLAACVSVPKQAFNKTAHQDVKTIVVLDPAAGGDTK
jgi:starvation-inducible outer membrane lipoprotein